MIEFRGGIVVTMNFGLYQQQTMKLFMTNDLRQAISILQYSTQELLSYLEEQQLENPLLEINEPHDELHLEKATFDYEKNYDSTVYDGENNSPFDYLSKSEVSLSDHLLNQIRFDSFAEKQKKLIKYLILSLDENGYLLTELAEIALHFSVLESEVLACLEIVQSLDPVGVGARSLSECLVLQLKELEPRNIVAETVVEQYLDMFANKNWKEIAKQLQVTLEDLQGVWDCIQALQPKPGSIFNNDPLTYISPDAFIEIVENELFISINDSLLPKLSVSQDYQQLLKKANDETSLAYVEEKHQQILWLLKSVEQRQQTLLKVTVAIAKFQEDFFKLGYEYLKPLTLKEIAADIEVHESTVSRVTTQKYVQTPKGLFELKYFFSSSLKGEGGSTASSLSVKELIKKFVDQEDKQKPLSDQKIGTMLKKEHSIEVSRRTVAKYRDELNILSSSKRKRF